MEQLSEELKKQCVLYLQCFRKAYYLQMGVELTTVDQIIDVITSKKFTFEDVFDTYLESCFGNLSQNLSLENSIFFDDNLEMFDVVNYYPEQKRLPEGGAWIKIRNKNGFEIHFAKVSNRKRRFNEEIEKLQRKLLNNYKSSIKDITTLTPAKRKKETQIKSKLSELCIRDLIQLKPYEVQIQRTKSVKEYYLPYQYEFVDDIETFSNAYVDALPGVKIKNLYTSQNEDAVFYLQSRGIPLKVAQIMAALKQSYFVFDMNVAMDAYNENFRECVKIVEV